jgi:hypothetical protein
MPLLDNAPHVPQEPAQWIDEYGIRYGTGVTPQIKTAVLKMQLCVQQLVKFKKEFTEAEERLIKALNAAPRLPSNKRAAPEPTDEEHKQKQTTVDVEDEIELDHLDAVYRENKNEYATSSQRMALVGLIEWMRWGVWKCKTTHLTSSRHHVVQTQIRRVCLTERPQTPLRGACFLS